MINVFSHKQAAGQIYESIFNGFLDYAPVEKFREVRSIQDADIIFMSGAITSQGSLQIHISNTQVNLGNLEYHSELYSQLSEKKRIIWIDTMGPSINYDPDLLGPNAGLKETDILISSVSLPDRPNTFTHIFHIEKSVFRQYQRFERVKGSILISHDNIVNQSNPDEDTIGIIRDIMDDVSHLYVTKNHQLDPNVEKALANSLLKVSCEQLSYPQGVAYHLSQAEFILSTHTNLGIEMMGIEGGLCGCQPIYPDTEFYRDVFNETGVVFYDTGNPVKSLKSIIQAGSQFNQETTEAFRKKFSAEDNLPNFWESVYSLYGG